MKPAKRTMDTVRRVILPKAGGGEAAREGCECETKHLSLKKRRMRKVCSYELQRGGTELHTEGDTGKSKEKQQCLYMVERDDQQLVLLYKSVVIIGSRKCGEME